MTPSCVDSAASGRALALVFVSASEVGYQRVLARWWPPVVRRTLNTLAINVSVSYLAFPHTLGHWNQWSCVLLCISLKVMAAEL